MSYQSDIITAIANTAAVTALVGTRVYADVADGSAVAPFIVYSVVTTGGTTTHDGNRNIEFPLIQFSCYAAGKAAVIDLASKLRAGLEGVTLSGGSDVTLVFDDQHGTRDAETNLFSEIIEFRGACNRN